jgi:hypothetical protein
VTGLHNLKWRRDKKKVTDYMRDKYIKRDIKLKYNSMNINTYRRDITNSWCLQSPPLGWVVKPEVDQSSPCDPHVVPPEPTPRAGW